MATSKKATKASRKRKWWHLDWSKVDADVERLFRVREMPAGELTRADLELLLEMEDSKTPWTRPTELTERQAALVGVCDWVVTWWKRAHRRKEGETAVEHRERLNSPLMAEREREQVESLCEVVKQLEPKSETVSPHAVLALLRGPNRNTRSGSAISAQGAVNDDAPDSERPEERRVTSPQRLALEVARLAEIWPNATADSLRKARPNLE